MRLFITTTAGIIASIVFLALMTCGSPTNPFDKSQANVKLILKSSSGQKNDTAITDTVGNTDTIGLVLYLAQYIDSTRLEVRNDTILEKSMLCTEKNRTIDTVYYQVVFSSPGSRSVTAKGYIPGELSLRAAATIHVIGRPQPNRKPNLNLSGSTTVTAGDTVKLHVSATDPDSGQTVTITAARLPAKSTFFKDTFMWATALTDAGSDTAVFIARDDGTPIALSDTDTVVITVSEIPLNRPPRWNDRVIDKTSMPGVLVALTLIDKCSDPDSDALTFSLLPGAPAGDTIVNSVYSFIPADGDTGAYAALIVARDPGNLADTLTLNLTIATVDKTPPVMRRIAPPRESLTVATSTYQVIISGGDESGIASVKCSMGADTFPVHRSDDTLYTATVSGLQPSGWNNIRFIATDSAPAANSCTLHVHLMYDRTIPDKVPPAITLLSPAADTVIGVDLCSIKARCTDDSGVALVRMSVGTDTVVAVRGSGADSDVFTATVKGLVPGQYSTVFITAVDSAAARNSMSIPVVRIKYDNDATGPVITRVTPSKDSVSTNASNYTVTVSCVDQSGVASVKGALGSQSFSGTKGSGNNWTIPVTGLIAHTVNEVAITATDSSLRANTSSINVYITYDPTIGDIVPPTLYFVNSSKDTVISVDSFTVRAVCKDSSGITLLTGRRDATPFTMTKSTTADSVWTGTVKGLPSGAYATIWLKATDGSAAQNKDSVSLRIKYDGDTTGPVMTRVTPAKDSAGTNASSYTIAVSSTDPSGVASVRGKLGSQTFNGTKGTGNTWTIPITGLTVNAVNTVVVTATDSSLRANSSSINVYITYDPTMDDVDGPTIKQISDPVSGSIVPAAAIEIVDSVGDPSGIDSVYWTLNNGAKKTMPAVSGKTGHYSLKDTITEGKPDTLVVTAVDKSTRRNRSTQTIILRFIQVPTITVQPASQAVCSGGQAVFSVTATGTAPLSYQWRTGAASPYTNIGGNYPRCTLSNVSALTILSCVVSNQSSTNAASNLCTLAVNQPPTITTQPAGGAICTGTNLTISVTATGASQYQWFKDGSALTNTSPYSNVTTATLTITGTTTAAAGSYTCTMRGSSGCSVTSLAAVLTVTAPPTITTQPAGVAICTGTNTTISVAATGASQYQWNKDGSALTNAPPFSNVTTATLTITGATTAAAGSYTCTVRGSSGCPVTSLAATLVINTPPSTAPALVTPPNDSNGVDPNLTFIWNKVTGATGYTLQVANNTAFSNPIMNIITTSLTDTSRAATGLSNSTRYYWRVGANNGCGTGTWKVDSFTTQITWDLKIMGIPSTALYVNGIAAYGGTLYIGTAEGVYYSTDNGDSWNAFGSGLESASVNSIVANANYVFASCGGIYRIPASGGAWTTVYLSDSLPGGANSLAINGSYLFVGTGDGVRYSMNNGSTWYHPNNGGINGSITALAVAGDNTLWAATSDNYINKSSSLGNDWGQYLSTYYGAVAVINNTIYASDYGSGIFYSLNNGTDWSLANSSPAKTLSIAGTGLKIFGASQYGVKYSQDGGKNYVATGWQGPWGWATAAAVSNGYIFIGSANNGILRSRLP